MPPTATEEDINAYQSLVEKNEISPHNMPACQRCHVESESFKLHAYRERRFLIIIEMVVKAVFCTLVRYICPGCRKTYTCYPDFALPGKHYTRQTIEGYSAVYTESVDMSYRRAVENEEQDRSVPEYPDGKRSLSPSSPHRWVGTLGNYLNTTQKALKLLLQENPSLSIHRQMAELTVPERKYRSEHRRQCLLSCRRFFLVESFFRTVFFRSIFTKIATDCFYT